MKAEIIAVGTELLLGDVVNTNSAEIGRMLSQIGIGVYHHTVVGDNRERLAEAFRTALGRVDLVIACGGLGPTEDDLTRETLADVLDRPLHRDDGWEQHLRELFVRRGWGPAETYELPQNNLRQTMVPEGADLLPNSRGTAPGIYLEHGTVTVALVPGPPREMRGLMEEQVIPRLTARQDRDGTVGVLRSRVLRVIGLGESRVAELLEDILAKQTNPTIAPLAQMGEMVLRLTAHAPDAAQADALLEETARTIYPVLGDAIYGENDETLEHVVGVRLAEGGLTVAAAESCTGGLVAHRITGVPGSSRYFRGGIVAYSNDVKTSLLGVPATLIETEGAVSEEVARAMAEGARQVCATDFAVSTTGIAGPDGGSDAKPVGLTWIAVACPEGTTECRRYTFGGDRGVIQARAAHAALELLRFHVVARRHP